MTTVAIVAALDRADSVAATVAALRSTEGVDEVVVVDDGSTDATAPVASAAGATVVHLPVNVGKGCAVRAGIDERPDAEVYLLVDADVAETASVVAALLAPVTAGDADMTVGVLPSAGGRGGFGAVKRLAAAGIRRATGVTVRAPLSGQRAVRGELLRSVVLADRFGLETALTIDALRAGARVVEVDVAMEHRHTGRRLAGFRHRAGQGVDIARALWPRLTSRRTRLAIIAGALVVAAVASLWSAPRAVPSSVPASGRAAKVVVFGIPRLGWDDIGTGRLPNLDAAVRAGAVAVTSVRTASGTPTTTEGYASLGAGVRVKAERPSAARALPANAPLDGTTAAAVVAKATGAPPPGDVVVVGGPATISDNEGRHLSSAPGALGDALHAAGLRTAFVGNSDGARGEAGRLDEHRPGAIALMASDGSVDAGSVGRDLLVADPAAPAGVRADRAAYAGAFTRALAAADVVLVDPGDLDRAAPAPTGSPGAGPWDSAARDRALADTDAILGDVRRSLGNDALLLVVSVAPRDDTEWHTTPLVAAGAGVRHGYLHSPSTRRLAIVTLTDVAPTVLDALGVKAPDGMIGHALRYHPGEPDLARLRRIDRDATYRERIYLPLTIGYISLQAIVYLLAMLLLGRGAVANRLPAVVERALRVVVLAVSAYPLATFLLRAVPNVAALGSWGIAVLVAIDAAVVAVALRFRRHPLSPLAWILGATVAVLVVDVATGARLQTSSLLGYSVHTAARFTGLGNTAFATLAATTVLLGAIHVQYSPRRTEAVVAVACLFAFVVLIDGAPTLGSDVGGILTLVPVLGLTAYVLAGGRVTARAVLGVAAVTVLAVAVATGVDLLRPPDARTHLGRLVADIGAHGFGVLGTTIGRKIATNFRTYRSPWTWVVVVLAVYMVYVLGWARGWRELLPSRSALRVGALGTLGAGLLGYAVNDSGVVVTALVFVYVGPFLTLLALGRARGAPTRVEPVAPLAAIEA
ncbi:MAG TPA: glycosyltransferase [Acidimicrobiales bacterium]|nr:glycosyltransferase [Acidimicrobiales bacterium]